MRLPWTLQRYIFREMGKTFLLTGAALAGVLGLGGGLREMIRLGEVTPDQLLRILTLVVPLAAALTLPVAALFSAAATYGRLSADNEFVACRSGGINLHVLFLPAIALSLVSAIFTFCLINFVIPGMLRGISEYFVADPAILIRQQLSRPRGMTLPGYRVFAKHCKVDGPEKGINRILLQDVAFIETKGDEWERYGTANALQAEFHHSNDGVRLTGKLIGLSFFDRQAGQFVDLAEQTLAATQMGPLAQPEIKFLNLWQLLHYYRHPETWREVETSLERMRIRLARAMFYADVLSTWQSQGQFEIADANTAYRVHAKKAAAIPRDGGVELHDVTIQEERSGHSREYTAERALVEVTRRQSIDESGVTIDAFGVTGEDGRQRSRISLTPVRVPKTLADDVEARSARDLLEGNLPASIRDDSPVNLNRANAIAAVEATSHTVLATLQERFAFSLSVLVLVVLAAGLGVVYRGAHAVIAFGVSFIPSLFVIVTIIAGKQMVQNSSTFGAGLLMMWAGIGIVTLLDWWLMARVLRR